MNALVTGHSGFIGRAVTRELDAKGIKWIGVSMSGRGPEPERLRCLDAMPMCDVVIHLAGKIGGSIQSWQDQDGGYIEDNALLALAVDRYAARTGAFVVYLTTQPGSSPYHLGKQIAEQILRSRPMAVLRLTNAYGPGAKRGLVAALLRQSQEEGPFRVNSTAPKRDFLHVSDIAECISLAARKRIAGTFDLAYGRQWSVGEVVDLVQAHTGPRMLVQTGIEPHETMESPTDPLPLRSALGWRPMVTLEAGIAAMFGKVDA